MTPERWQRVEDVLQRVLDCPPAERAAFLDEACRGDDELKREATELAHAFDSAGDFIEQPAIAQDARILVSDPADINVGRNIGPYRIVESLGAGGMGEVYLAHDRRLSRSVALKILPGYFVTDDARLLRFQREARAASALNHPNILTIHEVGEDAHTHFIATEFIDGRTIRALLATDAFTSLAEVLDISIQIASALEAAHRAGIVHRDIKPENIMLRTDGIVKVLDFGIAKLLEQPASESSTEAAASIKVQTEAGVLMGTVGYMSPEQARGLYVDERTDIWSLGVVLYEMLTGLAPFKSATRMDTLVSILERAPAPLFKLTKDVPPELKLLQEVVSKALSKERSERYQTATEMLADLKSIRRRLDLIHVDATLEGQDMLALVRALDKRERSEEETADFAHRPPTAAAHILPDTNPSTAQPEQTKHSRALALLLLVGLLLAGITGTLLYRRAAARRAANATANKLYTQMSEAEQLAFIDAQEQRISAMMGEHPVKLNEEALRAIKLGVDAYAARADSAATGYGRDNLRAVYARAEPFVPLIARSFAARKVPVIVGIYIPMVESEYETCLENDIGAKGLFQFLPKTARQYGVAHEEMCDVERMTPAAAHYIADRMAELGDDAQSMTLVILSYNRGPEGVRNALRQLRNTENYQRNFWTLFRHRDKLDEVFRRENARYVPHFFAAAIVGENPQNFGLQIKPLSAQAETAALAGP
ncbi:MAG TPA: serine/threonine-protein kinase [Pyrinomonadaceae bacterium]|nr:serine/threonine-protein kinase [Pyrinomonadaceae bacterium]